MGHVEITTIIPCINACKFCPQEVLVSSYKGIPELSFSRFTQALSKIPKGYGIHFSGFSEPFLNRESSKMMYHAFEQGYKVTLFSSLVGLTFYDIATIRSMKFENIVIHVPDDWNFIADTSEWISNYKMFTSYLKVNSASYYMGNVDKHISDNCNVYKASEGCLISRCNNVNPDVVPHVDRVRGNIDCIGGGHCPVMLPNGNVVICCMDWGLKHKTGNLFENSFIDLFKSDEFSKVRQSWTDESIETICRYCKR